MSIVDIWTNKIKQLSHHNNKKVIKSCQSRQNKKLIDRMNQFTNLRDIFVDLIDNLKCGLLKSYQNKKQVQNLVNRGWINYRED